MTTTTMDGAMATPARPPRLTSVDMLRGLVIVIMALDHTRDYFHSQAFLFDPTDAGATSLAVYLTRWVTHVCAPTFVLLAGMSAFLQGQAGKGRGALARFLVSRGLWLIFLEMVLLNYGWNFTIYGFGLQVIWALGVGMIALAGLIWLPRGAVLAIGVAICAGHNLLDPVRPADLGPAAPLWVMLHEGGPTLTAFFIVYPVLPWIGVMARGDGPRLWPGAGADLDAAAAGPGPDRPGGGDDRRLPRPAGRQRLRRSQAVEGAGRADAAGRCGGASRSST